MLNIKKIKPMHTKLVTTAERYVNDFKVNGIVVSAAGKYKEYQTVVSVGDMVRGIKVNDIVMINPSRYTKKKYDDNSIRNEFVENPVTSVEIPTIELDGVEHFLLDSGTDIEYVITDYEEVEEEENKSSTIIMPSTKLKL